MSDDVFLQEIWNFSKDGAYTVASELKYLYTVYRV